MLGQNENVENKRNHGSLALRYGSYGSYAVKQMSGNELAVRGPGHNLLEGLRRV